MADSGNYVTDAEVQAFCGITTIGTKETLIIQGIEAAVERESKRIFGLITYTDESYMIDPGELRSYGQIVLPRLTFALKHRPVTTFTSLKQVTSRNATTGAVATTIVIPRDCFYVELSTGIIRLLKALSSYSTDTLMNSGLLTSWPTGVDVLLATYQAGYATASVPKDLKLLILKVIARTWKRADANSFHVSSESGEMGSTSYVDIEFTEKELKQLRSYKKWAIGT